MTYTAYTYCDLYVNTWLALGAIALISDGRLIYKAALTLVGKKLGHKAIEYSIYAPDIKNE